MIFGDDYKLVSSSAIVERLSTNLAMLGGKAFLTPKLRETGLRYVLPRNRVIRKSVLDKHHVVIV